MKKNIKIGFSLAEILIALAIVSVIATMGFSIAKKGIADAYQDYFYTGYQGLNTAIATANHDYYGVDKKNDYLKHIINTLNLSKTNDCESDDYITSGECYTAPNYIKYKIENSENYDSFKIIMQVPSVKTNEIQKNYRLVRLSCENGKLKPENFPSSYSDTNKHYVNLATRKDLLAFICISEPGIIIDYCDESEENCKYEVSEPTKKIDSYNDLNPESCLQIKMINPKYYNIN